MRNTFAALFASALLAPVADATACGAADACADVTANFVVGVLTADRFAPELERAELQWWTDQEVAPAIQSYRVSRCLTPTNCSWIAALRPVGACGRVQVYRVDDMPPGSVGDWTYRPQVIRADGTVACSVDTRPR